MAEASDWVAQNPLTPAPLCRRRRPRGKWILNYNPLSFGGEGGAEAPGEGGRWQNFVAQGLSAGLCLCEGRRQVAQAGSISALRPEEPRTCKNTGPRYLKKPMDARGVVAQTWSLGLRLVISVWLLRAIALLGQQVVISTPPTLPQAFVDVSYFPAAAGTTRTATSCANIQTQINAAVGGDKVVIPVSLGTCTDSTRLNFPNHTGSGYVVVTTDQYSALPSPGGRVNLSHLSLMPIIAADPAAVNGNVFEFPSSGAATPSNYWWIAGIAVQGLTSGNQTNTPSYVQAGNIAGNGGTQTTTAGMPHHIILDRCLFLGDPRTNLTNGLLMECANCAVVGSYMDDVHGVGLESHGWLTTSGTGPILIQSNEIHALSNTFFFGGNDPSIVGLVPSDVVIRGNWFMDRPQWDSGLAAPAAPAPTAAATGGSIPCTTLVNIQITEVNLIQGTQGETLGSLTGSVTTPTTGCSASATVTVPSPTTSGDPICGTATNWRLYACTGASCTATLQGGNRALGTPVTLTTITVGAALPASNTTNPLYNGIAWAFKNHGELKNARRLLIENNVVENAWSNAQCGSWLAFNTASAGSATNETGNGTIRYNALIGQGDGGNGLSGITGPNNGQVPSHDASWTNNVNYNVLAFCGYQLQAGNVPGTKNLNYQHNTVVTYLSPSTMASSSSASGAGIPPVGPLAIHNNIFDKGTPSSFGLGNSCTEGGVTTDCFSNGGAYAGTESFFRNIAYNNNTACTDWPTNTAADWQKHTCADAAPWNTITANLAGVGFVDTANFDYRLLQSSGFVGAGTDGLDPGSDFVGVTQHVAGVSTSIPAKWRKIATAQVANLGQTSAVLKWINFGLAGSVDVCEFGTTTAYGTACTVTQNGDQNFTVITGLIVSTKYFWRVGGVTGMWGSFVTTGAPPAGRTLALGSTINPASTGTWSLDYGPTTAYGTTVSQSCASGTTCGVLANNVAAGAYHYCVRAPGVAACPAGGDKVAVIQ